jgi:hypothetical protein
MKYINNYSLLLSILIIFSHEGYSQRLSASTNEINLNLSKGVPDISHLPVIEWIFPRIEHTNSQENQIHVEAEISSMHPLESVMLKLSDASTRESYAIKKLVIPVHDKKFRIAEKVFIPNGSVSLELIVVTKSGVEVSGARYVIVGQDLLSNTVMIDRKDHALIFATDKYDHWDDLVNPVNDAQTIAAMLKEKYGFETEVVENPSVEEIWEKIRAYNERKFKPQDQLLIFFAGHGHFDESFGEGYVVAKNSLAVDKSRTTYLSHNRLRGVINNIPCQHIFLLMDVCFGGTFDPVLARSRGAMDVEASAEEVIVRKLSHKTRKYLTSGGKEYVSDGVAGSHSPFAGKLIESLKSNGGSDRILTIAELQASLEKMKQLPRFGSFGEDEPLSDFVFISK